MNINHLKVLKFTESAISVPSLKKFQFFNQFRLLHAIPFTYYVGLGIKRSFR